MDIWKDDNAWVKMYYSAGWEARQRGRRRKTWKDVVDKDINDLHLLYVSDAGSPRLIWINDC